MKTMTNRQLGGADDTKFHAETFEEMAEQCRQYCMEMVAKGDEPHIKAMNDMQELMKDPQAMADWMAARKAEFDALPDDE